MNSMNSGPRGFQLAYEVMTPTEEADLITLIKTLGLSKSYFTPDTPDHRSSMCYMHKYDMPSQRFIPAPPMPKGFNGIASRAADFAGVTLDQITHCALNYYEPGAWIQPHLDMPCWDRVVGVSLGAGSNMTLSRVGADGRKDVVDILLPPRSMYLLSDQARHEWAHGVPPVEHERWSITFRTLSERGMMENCDAAASRRYA